ncbi:MAG: hypothetical protein HC784_16755 [Hydrococcus sp. CSU_1_8]|nr:hypothetical protein [Hydrococcus sp. CSU_1_8]
MDFRIDNNQPIGANFYLPARGCNERSPTCPDRFLGKAFYLPSLPSEALGGGLRG